MKIIQCVADIEAIKAFGEIPLALIKVIEKDFLSIYEAESSDVYLLEFRLPPWQALFVLEKGDEVLAKINQPLDLEYVELVKIEGIEYFRCGIRNDHEFQLYYSIVGTHEKEVEDWLFDQSPIEELM